MVQDERQLLREEAEERWGDRWALCIKEWSDGTSDEHAYRMRGRVEDGELVERDELRLTSDGEIIVQRIRYAPRERSDIELVERAEWSGRASASGPQQDE